MMINRGVALYIHIPFCRHICAYCDFCHTTYNRELSLKWLDVFREEFNNKVDFYPKSIYLGGGTPTSLDNDIFEETLKIIDRVYSKGIEYTVEINPETFDEKKASLLKKYHINRVSIGLESSNDDELKFLGRHHRFKDVIRSIELLNNISMIDNYSLDILYSFPHETLDSFKKTIEDALSLNPKHLSLYSLTIEENTIFGKRGYESFDEDIEADYYEMAKEIFERNGYMQYEVSNFAIKGYESKHNLAYWYYEDFLGIGMGASSKINHQREDNTRNFKEYLNHNYLHEVIKLSKEDEMFEMVMMGMRLKEGVDLKKFKDHFRVDIHEIYDEEIKKLKAKQMIRIEDEHMIATNLEILNTVLIEFIK